MLLSPVVPWEAILALFRARAMSWQSTLPGAEEAAQHPWVREETGETWGDSVEDSYEWVSESEIVNRRKAAITQRGRTARGEGAKSLKGRKAATDKTEREEVGGCSWVWV